MSDRERDKEAFSLSGEDMRGWLTREKADIAKAAELRVAEASGFVEAYASSRISERELADRLHEYSCRWGEPLPGVGRSQRLSDKQILAKVSRARIDQGEMSSKMLPKVRLGSPPKQR